VPQSALSCCPQPYTQTQLPRPAANVAAEFEDIEQSARQSAGVLAPWRALLARRHRPQLVSAVLIPFFQEWTGLGALVVFGPEIFRRVLTPTPDLIIVGAERGVQRRSLTLEAA